MQIETVKIKNFQGIEDVEVDVHGKNVYAVGGNGAGKTSFIRAVWYALTGKDLPLKPTRNEAPRGLIEVDLGEYIARVNFKDKKNPVFELERKSAESEKDRFVKAPRTFLNDAIGIIDFDVNKFLTLTGNKQVEYFCSVINIDFSDIDAQIEDAAEQKKLNKRSLDLLKKQTDFYDKELAAQEPVDIVVLSGQIADAKEKWNLYDRIKAGKTERQLKIDELKKQLATLEAEVVTADAWLEDEENKPLINEAYDAMKLNLQTANEGNEKIAEAKRLQVLEADRAKKQEEDDALTIALEDLKRDKAKQLKAAINVEGLEYNIEQEGFTYNGLPFAANQTNTASQIIAGLRIGATLLKDLKILKLDASLVDNKNMKEIKAFAKDNNIELFVELVDRDADALHILVED